MTWEKDFRFLDLSFLASRSNVYTEECGVELLWVPRLEEVPAGTGWGGLVTGLGYPMLYLLPE